ncbi:MAG: hypothetical protein IT162_00370 [Bryobacterales bacterium]|nr:hypothetical protein [Bryobacterales bacterium]
MAAARRVHGAVKWVLLPGLDGTGLLFAPFLRVLPGDAEPVVVRYPSERGASADELLRIVAAHLPGSGPYVLIAESFSGPLALRAASAALVKPAAIVLCASFDRSPVPAWLLGLAAFAARHTPRALVRAVLLGSGASAGLARLLDDALQAVSPAAMASRFVALDDLRHPPGGALPAPLLYLRASRDRLVGARVLRRLRHRYASMTVETIDAPHLLLQANPVEASRRIQAYLR